MNTTELYDLFRSDVVDVAKPYLWSDEEVYGYMDRAHVMFARLSGGIADVRTEEVVTVAISAGEAYSNIHPSILTVREARLVSTGRPLSILNLNDPPSSFDDDFGRLYHSARARSPGPVRGMVVGEEYNVVRWVFVPEQDDEAQLSVYRLPLTQITGPGQDFEIRREHHDSLLYWMKHLAYSKQDAETFDRGKADENEARFRAYCVQARAEWERYKHKPRTIAYGGL